MYLIMSQIQKTKNIDNLQFLLNVVLVVAGFVYAAFVVAAASAAYSAASATSVFRTVEIVDSAVAAADAAAAYCFVGTVDSVVASASANCRSSVGTGTGCAERC